MNDEQKLDLIKDQIDQANTDRIKTMLERGEASFEQLAMIFNNDGRYLAGFEKKL